MYNWDLTIGEYDNISSDFTIERSLEVSIKCEEASTSIGDDSTRILAMASQSRNLIVKLNKGFRLGSRTVANSSVDLVAPIASLNSQRQAYVVC